MKYVFLAAQGLADEPVEELSGRTPLEAAKTPNMDRLAKAGTVGTATFTLHDLPTSGDATCLSMLGYDPSEFYTGIAPLDAAALGVAQKDLEIIFRCDLVTTLDDTLVDRMAGRISQKEAKLLVAELDAKLSTPRLRFHSGHGYKNLLIVSDAELAENLDELDCTPPYAVAGSKFAKHLPKGKAQALLLELVEKARAILDAHEINRVRVDLGENPANMIWPWGQGRHPKLPGFKARHGLSGAVVSDADFVKGLGKISGLETEKDLERAIAKHDFVFAYVPAAEPRTFDLKTKVRAIEDFDHAILGPALKIAESEGARVCVTTDAPESLEKGAVLHGAVPYVFFGPGFEASNAAYFGEKTAAQGKSFVEGHKLITRFFSK